MEAEHCVSAATPARRKRARRGFAQHPYRVRRRGQRNTCLWGRADGAPSRGQGLLRGHRLPGGGLPRQLL